MEDDMMVMMRKKQIPSSSSNSSSLCLNIHKDSHKVVKPKIRIIHIFAPEIIKTDVENFRELVQRLTGKPSPADRDHKKPRIPRKQQRKTTDQNNKKAQEIANGLGNSGETVQIQVKEEEEEEMWKMNNSGGFLSGFSDLDGFIQQFDDFNSMIHPIGANHLLGFGESQLA